MKTVLIAGALGLLGRAAVEHFSGLDGYDTEDALAWWLERMQRERLLPA